MTAAAYLEVPASSANLGPGFDTLGLAVGLHLKVVARRAETDSFDYRGDGRVADTDDNLVHQAFRAACRAAGREPFPVAFEVDNPIPLARGLGSSSAALVAGAAAADVMLGGCLGRDGVFDVTSEMEGHPDNVGPAIYGGWTVATPGRSGRYEVRSLPLPSSWRLLFSIPAFQLSTEEARRRLPGSYGRREVVLTAGRVAMWALAVARDQPELLATASQDLIHQPYRSELLPGFEECLADAMAAGAWCAYLSGAGPTVAAICAPGAVEEVEVALRRYCGADGVVLRLPAGEGYRATPLDAPVRSAPRVP